MTEYVPFSITYSQAARVFTAVGFVLAGGNCMCRSVFSLASAFCVRALEFGTMSSGIGVGPMLSSRIHPKPRVASNGSPMSLT